MQVGQTALSLASYHGKADMVQLLLSCGAHIDQRDDVYKLCRLSA